MLILSYGNDAFLLLNRTDALLNNLSRLLNVIALIGRRSLCARTCKLLIAAGQDVGCDELELSLTSCWDFR